MEFDDIRKIWDSQNNRPLYAIDEQALHKRIQARKKRSGRIADTSEIVLITANIVAGGIVLIADILKQEGNPFAYAMTFVMFLTAAIVMYSRMRRKRHENRFDRTLVGDLDHAIANAAWQVRLSQAMRWYLVPVAGLTLLSVWGPDKPLWALVLIFVFFIAVFYASGWEHRWYVSRKRSLTKLREKLMQEELDEDFML